MHTGSGGRQEIAHPNFLKRNNTPWSIQRGKSLSNLPFWKLSLLNR
jgi:hypothetical protein